MTTSAQNRQGPDRHATAHFVAERVTSIALLVLTPWFLLSAALGMDGTYVSALEWARQPLNALLLAAFLGVSLYHMHLGLRVVIEDYIAKPSTRGALLGLNSLIVLAAGAAGLLALYRISFGGS